MVAGGGVGDGELIVACGVGGGVRDGDPFYGICRVEKGDRCLCDRGTVGGKGSGDGDVASDELLPGGGQWR
jgi:hypothetical protein